MKIHCRERRGRDRLQLTALALGLIAIWEQLCGVRLKPMRLRFIMSTKLPAVDPASPPHLVGIP